jgi:hypothetical protein
MDRMRGITRLSAALRRAGCAMTALLVSSTAAAANDAGREALSVRVYNASVSREIFAAAFGAASRLLAEAGVDAEWRQCDAPARPDASPSDPCGHPIAPGEVIVRVASAPPDAMKARTLGEALVDSHSGMGTFATAFSDRIAILARQAGVAYAPLLGAVIAHEIRIC